MDFPWKRTFASAFILLSLNNGHVLSQNALQTGAMPLPVLRDPLWDRAGSTKPAPTQISLFTVPPNSTPGLMPLEPNQVETQLRRPILQDTSRQPGNVSPIGLINPQTVPCNSIPQNTGKIQRSPTDPQGSLRPLPVPPLNLQLATEPPNSCLQLFPNLYPQAYASPPPCKASSDLTSVRLLPTRNLPQATPVLNYSPLPPIIVQPNVPNFQISGLSSVSPFPTLQQPCNSFPVNFKSTSEDNNPMPINLQINVPPPNVPAPKINIITVVPGPATPVPITENTGISLETYAPYPLPPIIIEDTKSRSRSWLPLVLMALFARDGCQDGGCGGNCCCPCNTRNTDTIPFPIPIPTNNPIILGKPRSCKPTSK